MGPSVGQQRGLYIERPPYYHPPRNRPVSFEQPDGQRTKADSCFIKRSIATQMNSHQLQQQQQQQAQCQTVKMFEQTQQKCQQRQYDSAKLRNLPSHNTSPRPFARSHQDRHENNLRTIQLDHYYANRGRELANEGRFDSTRTSLEQQNLQQMGQPRILLNDQSIPYPTSTVHKSMLRSRSPVNYRDNNNFNEGLGAAHGRSASATVMSAIPRESMSPRIVNKGVSLPVQQHQIEMVQHCEPVSERAEVDGNGMAGENRDARLILDGRGGWPTEGSAVQVDGQIANYLNARNKAITANATYKSLPATDRKLCSPNTVEGNHPSLAKIASCVQVGYSPSKKLSSNTVLPDTKREEYMWNRLLERESIAHQTYRTLPIVMPKPKARHDLAIGNYMRLSYDPTWDLAQSRPASAFMRENHERKIQQAIMGNTSGSANQSTTGSRTTSAITNASGSSGTAIGSSSNEDTMPAFNYREYIESTRRGCH